MTETRAIDRRAVWAGVALCVVCLGYFFAVDRALFPTTRFSPIFRFLLAEDLRTAWLAVTICLVSALAVTIWNLSAPLLRVAQFLGTHAGWVVMAGIAAIALGTVFVYHDYPLAMDEYAAVLQAKIFATGAIWAQLPPGYVDWLVVRGFNGEFLIASPDSGRLVEAYWPGFALLLAPFEFMGVPWLCNACLAGLSLGLIHGITLEISRDRRAAGWALLFALASGAFLANAISFYSMQAHLTLDLLFAALLLRPTMYRAAAAGLVGSWALNLHNPFPHALFAIPWFLAFVRDGKQRRYLVPLMLGYLPGVAVGLGWWILRGWILRADTGSAVGMGVIPAGIFAWPDLTLLNVRAASLAKLWVWAVPSLFVLAVLGVVRHRGDSRVRLLASSAIVTLVAYFFVRFDQGHGWGYRYFHSSWGVIPILAACALTGPSTDHSRLVSFAGVCAILSLLILVPVQMTQIRGFMDRHLAQLGTPRRPGNNVYFIHPRAGFYVADMVQADPLLRDTDLLLVSHGDELDERLILRNWPDAVKIAGRPAADQWYLGPQDKRSPIDAHPNQRHFVLRPLQ